MRKYIFLFIVLISNYVLAHGEAKPGPHKGYIRMPGAFHTEVVPMDEFNFRLYLLDIDWKNPITDNSKVEVKISSNGNSENVVCKPINDHFECKIAGKSGLKLGELSIVSSRSGAMGAEVKYKLPLKFSSKDSHGGH